MANPRIVIDALMNDADFLREANKIQVQMDKMDALSKKTGLSQSALKQAMSSAAKTATMSWTDFRSMYSTVLDAFRLGEKVYAATYGEFAKLTDSVRDFALVSGTGAEDASRFIEVLSDFGLTAQDATTAARFLKRDGLSPNIETLAKLADQFKKIKDPAERLVFIEEKLGRGGAAWVNVLNQESDALLERAKAVEKNLVVSEMDVKLREVQRLAMDDGKDAIDSFTTGLGRNMAMVMAWSIADQRAGEIMKENGKSLFFNTHAVSDYSEALKQAMAEQLDAADAAIATGEAYESETEKVKRLAEETEAAFKIISDGITSQIGLINSMQSAENAYTEKSKSLTNQRKETEQELMGLRAQGYWEQSDQIQGTLKKLEDIKQAEADLETERNRQALQFVSNILAENLAREGWTTAEFDAFAKQQEAWGLWSADVVAKARLAWQEADKITASINGIPSNKTVMLSIMTNQIYSGLQEHLKREYQIPHAAGGDFMIPMSYGNEGFRMGDGDTASGGERVSIIPKGQGNQSSFDYDKMGKSVGKWVVRALAQAGG